MHALLFSAVAAWTPLHAPIHHRPPTSSPSIVCRAKTKDSWARRLPKSTPLAAGSVVCSAEGSFDHYFMDSIVLLVEHNEEKGSKGVLLTNETPFVVGDMTDGLGDMFAENTLFLGGDAGSDTMLMLHGLPLLEGARRLRPDHPDDPLSLGGVKAAVDLVEKGELRREKFKFFYKTVEWLPGQLEQQCGEDLFEKVEISNDLLLGQSGQRTMWREVRELMRLGEQKAKQAAEEAGDKTAVDADGVPIITGLPATKYAPAAYTADAEAKTAKAAPPPPAPPPAPPAKATSSSESSAAGIVEVLEHRIFMKKEQWRVKWVTGEESWEVLSVLDTDVLRRRAEELASA